MGFYIRMKSGESDINDGDVMMGKMYKYEPRVFLNFSFVLFFYYFILS